MIDVEKKKLITYNNFVKFTCSVKIIQTSPTTNLPRVDLLLLNSQIFSGF